MSRSRRSWASAVGVSLVAPLWLKAAALSGFLMTLLYVVLSILPIVQVESRLIFALKISSLIVLANVLGLAIFLSKRSRSGGGR